MSPRLISRLKQLQKLVSFNYVDVTCERDTFQGCLVGSIHHNIIVAKEHTLAYLAQFYVEID